MSLLEEMLKKSTIENTKGGEYYAETYNANLDMFSMMSRNQDITKVIKMFKNAYEEDRELALANLLYLLDIREGKGERKLFKTCFEYLCKNAKEDALLILKFIGDLGRYDYVLVGLGTPIENEVLEFIRMQLAEDTIDEYPSLLAKWLPTRKRVKDKIDYAGTICKGLNLTREQYRKILVVIRTKLKLIETKLSSKDYDIDFEKVPTKAMLKYRMAFGRHCEKAYKEYLEKTKKGEAKVNTKGLFAYEIIHKISRYGTYDQNEKDLLNAMWEQQKDVLNGCDKNILVMADTSGSMEGGNPAPIDTSIGMALYIAERNHGAFKDYYMTFSSRPLLQKVKGKDIYDKVKNVKCIIENTNIDKAFQLLLDTATEQEIPQDEMPSHIIIISDMEFDDGVYSKGGTNFSGWKKAFEEKGYTLPKIIFWNVSSYIKGTPATKFDKDVAMITGFSTSVFENILNIENFTPINVMAEKLEKYIKMIRGTNE